MAIPTSHIRKHTTAEEEVADVLQFTLTATERTVEVLRPMVENLEDQAHLLVALGPFSCSIKYTNTAHCRSVIKVLEKWERVKV